jgi:hypothetical protein
MIKIMPVRGAGVRGIGIILEINVTAVFKALTSTKYRIKPKQSRYDRLETGEFWTYVGKRKMRRKRMGMSYDRIATDDWDSFLSAFAEDRHEHGKAYTVGIEGNNCRLRIRRAFRRTCCFSKKLFNHLKAFDMPHQLWFYLTPIILSGSPSKCIIVQKHCKARAHFT